MITDFSKQMELIKAHEFKERINVIGCGAIGSWVVFFLLKMGFENIHVYDFDKVEEHNLPNQMFAEKHIGELKVDAIINAYSDMFEDGMNESRLTVHNQKIDDGNAHTLSGVVISCVDSMSARKEIYELAFKYGQAKLWIEGRLSIWGAYVYTLDDKNCKKQIEEYEKTLYADEEAEVSACGVSQTALPSAVNCATIMVMQMICWHREELDLNEIQYSIPWLTAITNSWKDK